MPELIKRLIQIQREAGMTDEAFASLLGVHRVMWSLVRRGKRQPGKRMIEGAFRLRPELSFIYAQALQISTPARAEEDGLVEAKVSA